MPHYSRKIEIPKNKQEGLTNAVQMIINRLECNEVRCIDANNEALMLAVDLLRDIACGMYREVAEAATAPAAPRDTYGYVSGERAGYARGEQTAHDFPRGEGG